jgi:hypothetical protein
MRRWLGLAAMYFAISLPIPLEHPVTFFFWCELVISRDGVGSDRALTQPYCVLGQMVRVWVCRIHACKLFIFFLYTRSEFTRSLEERVSDMVF